MIFSSRYISIIEDAKNIHLKYLIISKKCLFNINVKPGLNSLFIKINNTKKKKKKKNKTKQKQTNEMFKNIKFH